MTRTYYYFNPHTPGSGGDQWTEILDQAVRLSSEQGYIDEAQAGSVGISSVVIDDPTASAGHAGDAILGLKQFFIDEDDCPDIYEDPDYGQRLWTGYTVGRRYYRGDDSLITDGARKIEVALADLNSFLSFRLILPEAVDVTSSFDRPAETDIVRVAALLTEVDYLSTTLFDLGFVASSGGVAMDACDYSGQRPADVLNDCALASGRNYFVYYDEASNSLGLWYDFESSPNYVSPLRLTNVLSEVDDATTFAIKPDAVLERDPSRVVSGVLLDYTGGSTYRTLPSTSWGFGWRDATAPSANVKTLAKAEARADRFLADNAEESDLITATVDLPSSKVTGIKAGQLLSCHFSHLPGYEADFRDFRVVKRELAMPYATTDRYEMRLELSPMPPTACAPELIQSKSNGGGAVHIDLDNAVQAGSLLIWGLDWGALDPVQPENTGSWTKAVRADANSDPTGGRWASIFWKIADGTEGTVYSPGGFVDRAIWLAEFSTGDCTATLDETFEDIYNVATVDPIVVAGSITPSSNATLLIAMLTSFDNNTPPSGPFINLDADWTSLGAEMGAVDKPQGIMAYRIVTNPSGAYAVSATSTAGCCAIEDNFWGIGIVSFVLT